VLRLILLFLKNKELFQWGFINFNLSGFLPFALSYFSIHLSHGYPG